MFTGIQTTKLSLMGWIGLRQAAKARYDLCGHSKLFPICHGSLYLVRINFTGGGGVKGISREYPLSS